MKKINDLDSVYNQRVTEGNLQEIEEVDIEKAKSKK